MIWTGRAEQSIGGDDLVAKCDRPQAVNHYRVASSVFELAQKGSSRRVKALIRPLPKFPTNSAWLNLPKFGLAGASPAASLIRRG
jgi:hypothetical protein